MDPHSVNTDDTICALSTPQGQGALAVIRVSGKEALSIADALFSVKLQKASSHTVHYGRVKTEDQVIDEGLATVFRAPNSFTGEDVVEFSCHGSPYIQQRTLRALLDQGCRMAEPGEFSMRAFFNDKMDLSQAEAVGDLVASNSLATHKLAMHQLRGGFSRDIQELRDQLMEFASLIELELDFSEEDVEFADRTQLYELVGRIEGTLDELIASFSMGNAIKEGIPVAIVGIPNAGKSTLLNGLLKDDRAIVSEEAGTTRDTIEDEYVMAGIPFRFIDTAGIRESDSKVEAMGVERAYKKIEEASIVLYLIDAWDNDKASIEQFVNELKENLDPERQQLFVLANKIDRFEGDEEAYRKKFKDVKNTIFISAQTEQNIEEVRNTLIKAGGEDVLDTEKTVVTNERHYQSLKKAREDIERIRNGMDQGLTSDLIAMDIRTAIHHLGEITGEISTEDLLGNIFANFCIGK